MFTVIATATFFILVSVFAVAATGIFPALTGYLLWGAGGSGRFYALSAIPLYLVSFAVWAGKSKYVLPADHRLLYSIFITVILGIALGARKIPGLAPAVLVLSVLGAASVPLLINFSDTAAGTANFLGKRRGGISELRGPSGDVVVDAKLKDEFHLFLDNPPSENKPPELLGWFQKQYDDKIAVEIFVNSFLKGVAEGKCFKESGAVYECIAYRDRIDSGVHKGLRNAWALKVASSESGQARITDLKWEPK